VVWLGAPYHLLVEREDPVPQTAVLLSLAEQALTEQFSLPTFNIQMFTLTLQCSKLSRTNRAIGGKTV
jgi:hypothetical protein